VVSGMWCVVCGVWYVVCMQYVVGGRWSVVGGRWHCDRVPDWQSRRDCKIITRVLGYCYALCHLLLDGCWC
jgi:hypothetical protein